MIRRAVRLLGEQSCRFIYLPCNLCPLRPLSHATIVISYEVLSSTKKLAAAGNIMRTYELVPPTGGTYFFLQTFAPWFFEL